MTCTLLQGLLKDMIEQAFKAMAFFKSPKLPDSAAAGFSGRKTLALFIVLAAATIATSIVLLPFVWLLGAGQSSQLSGALSADPLRLVLTVMILGPIVEEILFRSWLSGRWRDIVGAGVFGVILYGAAWLLPPEFISDGIWQGHLVLAIAFAAFGAVLTLMGSDARSLHFKRAFPLIFWLSVVIFGALHLTNYAGSGGWALLVFTMPQILAGAFFGFARVTIGLPSAMALHIAYNAVPVTAALLFRMI